MKETFLSICKSHLAHDKNTDNDKAYKVKNFLTTVLPLRPWQAGTLCQTAFWGLAVPCPLPPTPCLGPDAPRLGKARSWPAHQGQFHLGSSQERGQCCRLPSAWGGRPAFLGCKVSVQRRSPALPEPRSPGTRAARSHAACAMPGSQFHALLQTPWDPGPSQTLCCSAFL